MSSKSLAARLVDSSTQTSTDDFCEPPTKWDAGRFAAMVVDELEARLNCKKSCSQLKKETAERSAIPAPTAPTVSYPLQVYDSLATTRELRKNNSVGRGSKAHGSARVSSAASTGDFPSFSGVVCRAYTGTAESLELDSVDNLLEGSNFGSGDLASVDEGGSHRRVLSSPDSALYERQKSSREPGFRMLGTSRQTTESDGGDTIAALRGVDNIGRLGDRLASQMLEMSRVDALGSTPYHFAEASGMQAAPSLRLLDEEPSSPFQPHEPIVEIECRTSGETTQAFVTQDTQGSPRGYGSTPSHEFLKQVTIMQRHVTPFGEESADLRNLRVQRESEFLQIHNVMHHRKVSPMNAECSEMSKNSSVLKHDTEAWGLIISGVLPWDSLNEEFETGRAGREPRRESLWYQRAVMLLVLMSIVVLVWARFSEWDGHRVRVLRSDLPLMLCSLAGMMALDVPRGSQSLCKVNALIRNYMRDKAAQHHLSLKNRWEAFYIAVAFSAAFGSRIYGSSRYDVEGTDVLDHIAFMIVLFALSALLYTCLYVCNALNCLMDLFAAAVMQEEQILRAVYDWNCLVALLRKASRCIEWCMITLSLASGLFVLLGIVDVRERRTVEDMVPLAPGAAVMVFVFRCFFGAARVSNACAEIPPLLNLMVTAEEVDREREYVVNFIRNSVAGFYVFGMRVTTQIVLKFLYVSGAVIFAFSTNVV